MSEQEKQVSNVLTSENSEAFYAQKLGLAVDAPVEAEVEQQVQEETPSEPVEEAKEQSEPQPEETQETKATEEKKPNPKLEKRFSELTKARKLAEESFAKEREQREALESRLKELEQKVNPQPQQVEQIEPKPEQFTDAFEYAKALAEYSTAKALENRDKAEAERKANEERARVMNSWQTKLEAAKSELPDYEDMIASSDVVVSDQVRDAILESDVGPKILYHLAENPDVADKIGKMSLTSALRELGKLEARLEKAPEPPKPTVKKSNAPQPINPIRGGSNVDIPVNSDGEFTGTIQEWKQLRKSGKMR